MAAQGGRGCLFAVAFVLSVLAAIGVFNTGGNIIGTVIAFFLVGIVYSVLAAGVVGICHSLRALAFPDSKSTWDHETAAMWGAVWPLSLCFWIMITPFFFCINRLFRKPT
jgi:hypothetical protein